jgi:hypothetical protein
MNPFNSSWDPMQELIDLRLELGQIKNNQITLLHALNDQAQKIRQLQTEIQALKYQQINNSE